MRIRKPSPSMVVAIIALVMASTGSAVAAVNYARNAGAVDGLSAVKPYVSNERAAGRLVATKNRGEHAGQLPGRFVYGVTHSDAFGNFFDTPDNTAGAQVEIEPSDLGTLNASCNDQAGAAGVEDPSTTVTFSNTSGRDVNYFRRVGAGDHEIVTLPNGTADSFTINNQNNFRIHVESFGTNVVFEGFVRQLNPRTANANCVIVGAQENVG